MINSGTSTFLFQPGAIFIVSSIPGPCGCGRAAFLFVNRNGKTRCLFCEHNLAEMPGVKVDLTPEEQRHADVAELANDLTLFLDDEVASGRYRVSAYSQDGKKLYRQVGN